MQLECGPDLDAPLRALAFKVVHDARRGPIVYVRVYSGKLVARSVITNISGQATMGVGSGRQVAESKERVMKLLHVYADSMTEVESVGAGHICALVGLKHTRTGDTLIGRDDAKKSGKKGKGYSPRVVLAPIVSPEPVFCAAIEAESNEELGEGLPLSPSLPPSVYPFLALSPSPLPPSLCLSLSLSLPPCLPLSLSLSFSLSNSLSPSPSL